MKPHESEEITPPSSFDKPPLTPPASDEKRRAHAKAAADVVRLFKGIKAGRDVTAGEPWYKIQLGDDEYNKIERLLDTDEDTSLAGFVEDKIRLDYDADTKQLVLRMPSPLHDCFAFNVNFDIATQLDALKKDKIELISTFAGCLRPCGTTDIHFLSKGGMSKKSPDASFYHKNGKWPGVIIEVSYSQKRKDLPKLADRYIKDSKANVRAVVGIDIEYQRKSDHGNVREAVLSVWKPVLMPTANGREKLVAKQVVENQKFRDPAGNPVPGAGLVLHLSDFARNGLTADIKQNDRTITITPEQLCEHLADAENQQDDSPPEDILGPNVDISSRESTPEEEIPDSDVEVIQSPKKRKLEDAAEHSSLP